ncbi:type VI secretion system-associated protein TagF [candidate division KSB1 bacterium]|nr:type VI secretion system-associated protein TagF [candidate division KSB1 bacterium]
MANSYFPAGAFGKLPQFGDFFKHNAGSREMLAFDQWLQQGIFHAKMQLKQEWDVAFDGAPGQHFLFYADNPERFLLGVFQPSHDKTVRKYPFWVSLQIERAGLGEALVPLTPVIFSSFFMQARALIQDARNGLSMPEIIAHVEALKVPVTGNLQNEIRGHRSYLDATTLGSFCTSVFGSFEDQRKYLLFKNLTDILVPLRRQDFSRMNLGLRFPLGADPHARSHETCFWLYVCLHLLGNPAMTPILFWSAPKAGQKAYLYFYFRPPSAKNFLPLVRPEVQNDAICELEEEGWANLATAEQALAAPIRASLQAPGMSLSEFLQKL